MIDLWDIPETKELYMIAGWRQWADAGSISSGLPKYLIDRLEARKIGELKPQGYYLFQFPGTHHLLRPIVQLKDGYRQHLDKPRNEFFYAGDSEKGLIIFLGDEPHLNVDGYAEDFFEVTKRLGVKKVAGLGGVYGSMPYDRARQVSCVYSMPDMKSELEEYAMRFSEYEGGVTIGGYLIDAAEHENVPMIDCYAFVPAYDFTSDDEMRPQGFQLENDFKAWFDIMVRLNHYFDLSLDLANLEERSRDLVDTLDSKVAEMEQDMPQLNISEYLTKLNAEFEELAFNPLSDVWDSGLEGLDDLFESLDD